MRRWAFWVCLILSGIGSLIWVSCSLRRLGKPPWQPPNLVAILGEETYSTFRHWPLLFGPTEEGKPAHLLLRGGEVFFTEDGWAPYRKRDGTSLTAWDGEGRTMINGKTATLDLDQEEVWTWLEKATPEEMEALRFIHMSNTLEEHHLSLLKRLSKHNLNVGLSVEEPEVLRQSLSLFDPVFLGLFWDEECDLEDFDGLRDKKRVRTLILGEKQIKPVATFLSRIAGLETLIIFDWYSTRTGPLPENLTNLKRLILLTPELRDLTMLGNQPNLEELSVIESSSLEHLAGLSNYPELKVLGLRGCGNVKDLTPLSYLKRLRWLSLPPTTTQEQLKEILREHPDLVVLELFGLENVIDLTPITDLRKLRYLLVNCSNARPDPLFEMKNLRWLAVSAGEKGKEGKETPGEEDLAVELQQALPQTAVVRVEPLCVGSGWIFLLAPAVVMAWWITRPGGRDGSRMEADSVRVANHHG